MISTLNFADHVLALVVENKIDKDKIDEIKAMIDERLQTFGKINLYLEMEGNEITIPALIKDFSYHLNHQEDFEKIAVVTNLNRVQKFVELKNFFLKSDMQAFDIKDRISAMNWVME